MFELEISVKNWRQSMLASESLRAEDVDELEDHLREEFERLRAVQAAERPLLREAECFLLATNRIGSVTALDQEFAKADPAAAWRRRGIWMLVGYLGIGLALSLIGIGASIVAFVFAAPLAYDWKFALYAALTLLGVVSLLAVWRAISRANWSQRNRAFLARILLNPAALALIPVLALALKPAVVMGYNLMVARGFDVASSRMLTGFGEYVVILAPPVFLVILILRDRERLRRMSKAPPTDEYEVR